MKTPLPDAYPGPKKAKQGIPGPPVKPNPQAQLLIQKRKALYDRAIQRVQNGGNYGVGTLKRLRAGGYKGPLPDSETRRKFPGSKLS